ncbi:hypothetical protein QJS04_geneDACA022973 [Acorus gramineus]|uniref:Reverse transcriptase n=1 Tax=Acorus gramineus TaxID=55184 RepID=A0AAV8ZZZ9_ACOGR|nr:hypothetical protein QJS04_geneDACA022973 [Acorus gramineus]
MRLPGAASVTRLDCVLVDTAWEDHFPFCSIACLPRITSDHRPILLSRGVPGQYRSRFHFETWWLKVGGFRAAVASSWSLPVEGVSGAKKMAIKLKRLTHFLKGWCREAKAQRVAHKTAIAHDIAVLDVVEDSGLMGEEVHDSRIRLKVAMQLILGQEEEEWRLRSRAVWLKEGDNNAAFFHKVANHRRRVNKIDSLLVGDTHVTSEAGIQEVLVEHFAKMAKAPRGKRMEWFDEDLPR